MNKVERTELSKTLNSAVAYANLLRKGVMSAQNLVSGKTKVPGKAAQGLEHREISLALNKARDLVALLSEAHEMVENARRSARLED